jgi:hypothetical protein
MLFDFDIHHPPVARRSRDDDDDDRKPAVAPVIQPLPADYVLTQHLATSLREYLAREGLAAYRLFHGVGLDLEDAERYFDELEEPDAVWDPLPTGPGGAEALAALTHGTRTAKLWQSGVLRLRRFELVLARWYWVTETDQHREVYLCAAPSPAHYIRLRDAVRAARRRALAKKWQILTGYGELDPLPRTTADADGLLLLPELRRRIEMDVVRFFSDDVAALYRALNVPYRRGVLLHGPPGNGKTSLMRLIGAALPDTPMLILRPTPRFDGNALARVSARWSQQAPAVLIIEDLDWLLKELNVSAFLNALDGIDTSIENRDAGLLLIATTNHPDKLDPAINNRPGRFDVVIEVPCPNTQLRDEFVTAKLPELPEESRRQLVDLTEGLSFAHLQEILRLSGLLALHAGRNAREADDVHRAAQMVRDSSDAAEKGYVSKFEAPFGLAPRRRRG